MSVYLGRHKVSSGPIINRPVTDEVYTKTETNSKLEEKASSSTVSELSAKTGTMDVALKELATKLNTEITDINDVIATITTNVSALTDTKLEIVESGDNANATYPRYYVKFSNGLIIQWGRYAYYGAFVDRAYPLAYPFSDTMYGIAAMPYNTTSRTISVGAKTTTTFNLVIDNNADSQTITSYVIAIGY
jgi:hypothetical protein